MGSLPVHPKNCTRARTLSAQWAEAHDGEAEQVARAGQDFALEHLHLGGRRCFWQKLLIELASLITYEGARACRPQRLTRARGAIISV